MDPTKVDVTKIDVVKMDSTFWSGQVAMAHYLYFNTAPDLPGRTETAILENRKRVDAAFWARHLTLEQMIILYNCRLYNEQIRTIHGGISVSRST